jgi:hypothetical protein
MPCWRASQVIVLATNDAGALFRFTHLYAHMVGGQMSISMDPPSAANPVQQGAVVVQDFAIRDEAQLQRAFAQNGAPLPRTSMEFSSMRVDFTRTPGKVLLREGVVRGPVLGATIDGSVDYTQDELHLYGTFIPLYGPNNLIAHIPIVNLLVGGEKEGLFGFTYEVVGRPGNPVLNVNPISGLAPGLLRKVFAFPVSTDSSAVEYR